MTAKTIMQSCRVWFKAFRAQHIANIALLVTAVLQGRRLGVAVLGRNLAVPTSPKHAIKRVDRFLSNPGLRLEEAKCVLLRLAVGQRASVVFTVDWTTFRRFDVLVAAVVHRGRAVAVLWAVYEDHRLYKSQNAFENGFFTYLASCLPPGVRGTVLLDRGFRRVEVIPHLERCGLGYVIRTGGNVHVHSAQYQGCIDKLIGRRGVTIDIPLATLRPSRPVQTRLVGAWDRGQKEPWLLMTNVGLPPRLIIKLYGKRFSIEETFRDEKDGRFGLFLGQVLITKAHRIDCLLFIAALAHFLALLIGTAARRRGWDRLYRANTERRKPTHSDFTLGLYYWCHQRWKPVALLRLFFEEAFDETRG